MNLTERFGFLKSDKPVLVDVWAEWCGPCKRMLPVIEELETENVDIKFVKVNVEEHKDFIESMGISSVPTFLLIKNGIVEGEMVGAQSKQKLQSLIDKHKMCYNN